MVNDLLAGQCTPRNISRDGLLQRCMCMLDKPKPTCMMTVQRRSTCQIIRVIDTCCRPTYVWRYIVCRLRLLVVQRFTFLYPSSDLQKRFKRSQRSPPCPHKPEQLMSDIVPIDTVFSTTHLVSVPVKNLHSVTSNQGGLEAQLGESATAASAFSLAT